MTHLQYKQAGKYSFPEDAVKSQDKLKAIHPQVIDFVKDWFTFLLRRFVVHCYVVYCDGCCDCMCYVVLRIRSVCIATI